MVIVKYSRIECYCHKLNAYKKPLFYAPLQVDFLYFNTYPTTPFDYIVPNVSSKVENKISGCVPNSRGMLATKYISNGDKEQRKAARVQSKYNQMIISTF